LAGTLEVEEPTETSCAGTSAVAGGAGVGTVGADTTARSDGRVAASRAEVYGGASSASSATGDAFLLGIIVVLISKTALLAD
jgi:hypothetical protein